MAPDTNERGEPGSGPRTGVIDDAIRRLKLALSRARSALLWERAWPAITAVVAVAGIFLAFSWAGFWLALPPIWRIGVLALFGLVLIASLVPAGLVRWPRRAEALRRLDRGTGIEHRPATTISDRLAHGDEDPVIKALWQRPCRACGGARGGAARRLAQAAARRARPLCAARARGARAGRHLFHGRGRALEARHGGVRFLRRHRAAALPRGRLGNAAGLYRPRAGAAARRSSRRTGAGRDRRRCRSRRKRARGARHGSGVDRSGGARGPGRRHCRYADDRGARHDRAALQDRRRRLAHRARICRPESPPGASARCPTGRPPSRTPRTRKCSAAPRSCSPTSSKTITA